MINAVALSLSSEFYLEFKREKKIVKNAFIFAYKINEQQFAEQSEKLFLTFDMLKWFWPIVTTT